MEECVTHSSLFDFPHAHKWSACGKKQACSKVLVSWSFLVIKQKKESRNMLPHTANGSQGAHKASPSLCAFYCWKMYSLCSAVTLHQQFQFTINGHTSIFVLATVDKLWQPSWKLFSFRYKFRDYLLKVSAKSVHEILVINFKQIKSKWPLRVTIWCTIWHLLTPCYSMLTNNNIINQTQMTLILNCFKITH